VGIDGRLGTLDRRRLDRRRSRPRAVTLEEHVAGDAPQPCAQVAVVSRRTLERREPRLLDHVVGEGRVTREAAREALEELAVLQQVGQARRLSGHAARNYPEIAARSPMLRAFVTSCVAGAGNGTRLGTRVE
jgi:hypothetical protein